MIAFLVVMVNELRKGATQRWLTEEDHLIQTTLLDGSNKPFRVGIEFRGSGRQAEGLDSGTLENGSKRVSEYRRAIVNQQMAALQEAIDRIGQIAGSLLHPGAVC